MVLKFLFFPMPAHGHVNPMLPLLQELVSRGDEVAVYATREFEAAVRHTGAAFRPLDDALGIPASFPALSGPGGGGGFKQMLPLFLGLMRKSVEESPRIVEQARGEQADCVVYDPMCGWGKAVATMLKLPAAVFHTSFGL
ncbi:MAG TPA: hypothetical protein VEZ71_30505, partial [Archangium sp.]|nr:hypothetical protein [Archangium sp.]